MEIGIACTLRSRVEAPAGGPDDALEEYDSERTVEALAAALAGFGHRTRVLHDREALLRAVLDRRPDLVFNIAEGVGGRCREAHVPAALEMLGIPYTHSDPLTLAACQDKAIAKRLVAAAGVPTPPAALLESPEGLEALGLCFPVVAKPLHEGSSMGVWPHSRADDVPSLRLLVERLVAVYRQPCLVEEFCPGPEFTVGLMGGGRTARVLGVMEVVPLRGRPEDFLWSLEVKRNHRSEVAGHAPPDRPGDLVAEVVRVALEAYRALGVRDIGRADIRVDRAGRPSFLEMNPLPGLHPESSSLVILAAQYGMDYDRLIGGILGEAIRRGAA